MAVCCRIFAVLMSCLVAAFFWGETSLAESASFTRQEKDWLAAHPSIEITYNRDGIPASFQDKNGAFSGIFSDIFTLFADATGSDFVFVPAAYGDIVENIRDGDVQVVVGFDSIDYRGLPQHYLESENFSVLPFGLFARRSQDPLEFRPDNIQGKKIAIAEGWDLEHPALKALGDCSFIFAPNPFEALNMVLNGSADAMFEVSPLVLYYLQTKAVTGIDLMRVSPFGQSLNIHVNAELAPLRDIFNHFLALLSRKEKTRILDKWDVMPDESGFKLLSLDLTPEERQWLAKNHEIRIGANTQRPPFSWQVENGEFLGLSVDYIRTIEKILGLHLTFVPCPSWRDDDEKLREGDVDMVLGTVSTDVGRDNVIFTQPYFQNWGKIFMREDEPYIFDLERQLKGRRAAVIEGFAMADDLKRSYPGIEFVPVQNTRKGVLAVDEHSVDAFFGNFLVTSYVLKKEGLSEVEVRGDNPFTYPLCFGVSQAKPLLASILDKALAKIPPEQRETINSKWFFYEERARDYSIIWKVAIPVLIVVVVALLWTWILRREVRRQTANLQETAEELQRMTARLQEAERLAGLGHWKFDYIEGTATFSDEIFRITEMDRQDDTALTRRIYVKMIHPEDREAVVAAFQRSVDSRAPFNMDYRIRLADGRVKHVNVQSRTMYDALGKALFSVGTIQDISARVSIEEKLRQSDKLQAIGQLAGGIAHDFNNMLGGILNATELLSSHLDGSEQSKTLHEIILKATHRAADLTRQLLSFARRKTETSTVIDLHQNIRESVDLLRRTLNKNVRITLDLKAENPYLTGDPGQLQNVFLNLGINAGHAMPDGGELVIRTREITLDATYCMLHQLDSERDSFLEVQVQDEGIGIPQEHLSKIFEPFFTTREGDKGTGLGLATVYSSIKQHQGDIQVESEKGQGTTFTMYLPVAEIVEDEGECAEDKNTYTGSGCILIIDDEEIMRVTAKAILEMLGYNVLVAKHGEQGLEIYRENQVRIDLVLVDMVMPVMNGQECFRRIRELDNTARVIVATGFSMEEAVKEMGTEGPAGFIQKPYGREELGRVIQDALRNT